MSSSRTTLTALPLELQAQIFRHYFKADGGYVFNGDSEKLTTANGKPIDLALMYTCRSIANLTRGMPLSLNTVRFSTVYREDWMPVAGCFNFVTTFYPLLAEGILIRLEPLITPEMYSELAPKFPEFVEGLQNRSRIHQETLAFEAEEPEIARRRTAASDWSNPFCFESFVNEDSWCRLVPLSFGTRATQGITFYVLRILAEKQPAEFAKLVFETLPHWVNRYPAHEFLELGFNLWDIPSRSELARVVSRLGADVAWQIVDPWYYKSQSSYSSSSSCDPLHKGTRCRKKIRFSAAAVAIRFLGRLTLDQRLQFRNMTLNEDFIAAGDPPSHARGLAPFFRENSRLRVERRVSVIRCISEDLRLGLDKPEDVAYYLQEPDNSWRADYVENYNHILCLSFLTPLAHWLLDALAVPDAGIPAESFTFVLDGGPDIDFCTDLFQRVVHRDIAWDKAYKSSIQRDLLVRWPARVPDAFLPKGCSEAIEHLRNQTSLLRANFNTGHPWEWEDMVEKEPGTTQWKWVESYNFRQPFHVDFPPALDYSSILADNFDIQTEDEYR